ncbi:anther-specific proline-rich protein APG [Ricinus communis]|uniref:anther-specific proline-rich protein APG n=1 Tax=Ricinus communis TaxID=3988 RepID=UPI00201AF588|nr:anther-specific proline-rich protein APG [Ricinus communis]
MSFLALAIFATPSIAHDEHAMPCSELNSMDNNDNEDSTSIGIHCGKHAPPPKSKSPPKQKPAPPCKTPPKQKPSPPPKGKPSPPKPKPPPSKGKPPAPPTGKPCQPPKGKPSPPPPKCDPPTTVHV